MVTSTLDPSAVSSWPSWHAPRALQYWPYGTTSREACRRLPRALTSSTRSPIPGGWGLFPADHSNATVRSPAHDRLYGATVPLSTGAHDRCVPVASDTVSNPLLFGLAYASMLASWETANPDLPSCAGTVSTVTRDLGRPFAPSRSSSKAMVVGFWGGPTFRPLTTCC